VQPLELQSAKLFKALTPEEFSRLGMAERVDDEGLTSTVE
jgi:hypothetical protein